MNQSPHRLRLASAALAVLLLLPATMARAVPFSTTFGPVITPDTLASQIQLEGLPTTIVGDMTIDLALIGDLQGIGERAALVLDDTLNLGTMCNNDPNDDPFGFGTNGDDICEDQVFYSGTVTVANALIAPLLADGVLRLRLFRAGDNTFAELIEQETTLAGVTFPAGDSASSAFGGTLSFETGIAGAVPEPASLLIFAAGLAGIARLKRRAARRP